MIQIIRTPVATDSKTLLELCKMNDGALMGFGGGTEC